MTPLLGSRRSHLKGAALAAVAVLFVAAVARAATAHHSPPSARAAAATPVAVFPSPGDRYETPQTQITFRGLPAGALGTIKVSGSVSGVHAGTLVADSDGDGGSFIPATPFVAGETVTVQTGLDVIGGKAGAFSFVIEHPGAPLPAETLPDATAPNDVQRFRSRPDLQPAAIVVTKDTEPASDGDIFIAPQFGPAQDGPMIVDPRGNLIWFLPYPMAEKTLITDFAVQQLDGQPVLTWWQGSTNNGSGRGEGVIFNDRYQQIATVHTGNGLQMDLHEFLVTNTGDAWVIAIEPIHLPGFVRTVQNAVVQEIDIKTGLVLFQWDALDHIPLSDSYTFGPKESGEVLDPYHVNSVSLDASGNPLISARNTWAVYDVNERTGATNWTLGGKHSSFKLGSGAATAFQHDAVVESADQISMFDDGAGPPKVHTYSRGVVVDLNFAKRTATLVRQVGHSPGLSAAFEGSVQELPGGELMLGWGQQPYLSEVDAKGQVDFDAHFVAPTASYRAYRFVWNAQPPTLPALTVGPGIAGSTTLWESWNGATDVAAWRVLAGSSPAALQPIARYAKYRFESSLTPGIGDADYEVQALSYAGQVLATSPVRAVEAHTQIFGSSAFVSPGALGGLPVGCYSTRPCHLSATVTSGSTVLARTGSQYYAPNTGGLLFFRLSPGARTMLAHSAGNRLNVDVSVHDSSGAAGSSTPITLIGFAARGAGPPRSSHPTSAISFVSGTAFVSAKGVGAELVQCHSQTPCRVQMTVSSNAPIAHTGSEYVGANQVGYVYFTLNAAGRSDLARAGGNQFGVGLSVTGDGPAATAVVALTSFR
jgi:arylsulfotransferase ASST